MHLITSSATGGGGTVRERKSTSLPQKLTPAYICFLWLTSLGQSASHTSHASCLLCNFTFGYFKLLKTCLIKSLFRLGYLINKTLKYFKTSNAVGFSFSFHINFHKWKKQNCYKEQKDTCCLLRSCQKKKKQKVI